MSKYLKISFLIIGAVTLCVFLFLLLVKPEINVTDIKLFSTNENKNSLKAKITINGVIVINDIQVKKDNGEISVSFPCYIDAKKRVCPQLRFESDLAKNELLRAIKRGTPSLKKKRNVFYTISNFSFTSGKTSRKANVEVTFNNSLTVVCAVMHSNRGMWVAWPSKKNLKGKWEKQIYIKDKELKRKIENEIRNKYKKWLENYYI